MGTRFWKGVVIGLLFTAGTLLLITSCAEPTKRYLGSHYTSSDWASGVRDPGGTGQFRYGASQASLDALQVFLTDDKIVTLNIGGLASAHDEAMVAAFMDGIEADGGAQWKEAVYEKVIAVAALPGSDQVYWQIGNEINSPGYHNTLSAWAGEPFASARSDSKVIPLYSEYYLAPALEAIITARSEGYTVNTILGSVSNFGGGTAQSYMEGLMEYQIVGTYAPSLAGVYVKDATDIVSYHYAGLNDGEEWEVLFNSLYTRWPSVKGFWDTEDVAHGMSVDQGISGATALRMVGDYLDWWIKTTRSSTDHRLFIYAQDLGPPETTAEFTMTWLYQYTYNCVPVATDIVAATGENLSWSAFGCGKRTIIIIGTRDHRIPGTLDTLVITKPNLTFTSVLFDSTGPHEDVLDLINGELATPEELLIFHTILVVGETF